MAYEGWIHVSSIEEANDKITAFETATTSRFCCVRADKDFGRTGNIFFKFPRAKLVQQLMAGCDSGAKRMNG